MTSDRFDQGEGEVGAAERQQCGIECCNNNFVSDFPNGDVPRGHLL